MMRAAVLIVAHDGIGLDDYDEYRKVKYIRK